ncbi:MAG: tRNA (N(6)-L-threonylcarbamoyladenosine(37)-C(2))-methylthiotransferase MtaB [Lachnospiraceae bacterium]|nr:tRNA (N(6)-L-threonylcarbamoyladenosine(37)-C(2))-methylthiotransferase MtaB [Lachnospiraceae bacterium]
MNKRAAFHTLGCRVNAYETEAMAEQLQEDGYEIVPFETEADVYVINTCTVTNIADRKSRQMLHRAREMNPGAVIVAAGCYAEGAGGKIRASADADLILGNSEKLRIAEFLRDHMAGRERVVPEHALLREKEYRQASISRADGRTRAFVKIQDGCNQFCTYCMIPYVRGRVRSRSAADILSEAERLAEAGYAEIILTGIHISSYGIDFDAPGENRQTPHARNAVTNQHLLKLARDIAAIDGVKRLRFGSLEPGIMTEEFVNSLAEIPEICPQFHLSLQSGCDATLSRMNRRYDTAAYETIVGRIRKAFPCPAITTDVIAGFPGETEAEFAETIDFVTRIGFAKMHIFKYSRRDGTKAASMKGQLSEKVKKERSDKLAGIDRICALDFAKKFEGADVEVLFEERRDMGGTVYDTGHTKEAVDALCISDYDLSGKIVRCRVVEVRTDGALLVKICNI